jgi:hypothetical protein
MPEENTPINPEDHATLILPRNKILELEAFAASQGCTLDELFNEVLDRVKKDAAFKERAGLKAKEIHSALERGEDISDLWPIDIYECLLVAALLDKFIDKSAEEYLLETSPKEMDRLEQFCRVRGWSYEELAQQALLHRYNREGDTSQEQEDDSDWWKV